MILIGPAMFAAIWKMTFDSVEKLNTRRWLDAHIDVVLDGIVSTHPKNGHEETDTSTGSAESQVSHISR